MVPRSRRQQSLHRRLEKLQQGFEAAAGSSPTEVQCLLHDLQVHQVELEAQNLELREARDALDEARERYARLYDFAPVGYLTVDAKARVQEINLTGAAMFGRPRGLIMGHSLLPRLSPRQSPALLDHLKKAFANPEKVVTEVKIRDGEGGQRDVRLESVVTAGVRGQPGLCQMVMMDVTEIKRAEAERQRLLDSTEALVRTRTAELTKAVNSLRTEVVERERAEAEVRVRESALNEAQRISQHGSWNRELPDGREVWSAETYRILGLCPEELEASAPAFLAALHPDDRGQVVAAEEALFRGEAPEWLDLRVCRPDRSMRVVRLQVALERDAAGAPRRLVGTLQDITEQKAAEASLRLAAAAFENTAEAVTISDPEGRILAVNRAFERITGYPADEALGQKLTILGHDGDKHGIQRVIDAEESQWQGEVWNRRKSGEIYPAHEHISAVRDDQGRIVNFVSVLSDITEAKDAEDRLQHLAHHDSLTGLPNRLQFGGALEGALERAKRHNQQLALLFLDLDRFKNINDTLGHDSGDRLLKGVAERLRKTVRAEDFVARLGGDEFTVVMEELASADDAAILAEKLIEALARPMQLGEQELTPSATVGIAVYPDDGADPAALLKAADVAMYRAKAQGRQTFEFYTPELTARALELAALEQALRHALERGEFILHYQPLWAAAGQVLGVEALLRWNHPKLGAVAPERFVPVAEEMGLIGAIGAWVLRTACEQSRVWREAGAPRLRLSVNVSMHQIAQGGLFLDEVRTALARCGIDPADLELEITETALQTDPDSIGTLVALKALGVRLAIDDFGTGYSSLSSLRRLPVDTIKIDRSFIRDVAVDENDRAVASAIIAVGHALNLTVTGEGVETDEQQIFLREQHCDQMQGFGLCRPMTAAQLAPVFGR